MRTWAPLQLAPFALVPALLATAVLAPAVLALAPAAQDHPILLSFGSTTEVPVLGIVADEDLIAYDPACAAYSLYFDGSDVGLSGADVDAVHLRENGDLLLSFTEPLSLPGLLGGPNGEQVDDSDLVRFTPFSVGGETAGSFSFFFDGSDVGLDQDAEDVDGVWERSDGSLVLTTQGAGSVPDGLGGLLFFADADAVAFTPTSTGAVTNGSYALLFDGSKVGLAAAGEGLDAIGLEDPQFAIQLSVDSEWSTAIASGSAEDIVGLAAGVLGPATSGVLLNDLDLSTLGFDRSEDVDAFSGAQSGLIATPLKLVDCTLGCTGSGTIVCAQNHVFANQELAFDFSEPLDLSSLSPLSFQLLSVATGATVPGTYSLAPNDAKRLIFRPQLAFDAAGSPVFGFEANQSYQITIPGTAVDPGPYLTSTDCTPNEQRFECVVVADLGVQDVVPGPPLVQVFVDVVQSYDPQGHPEVIASGVPADGAVDVFRGSDITYVFNDVMNLSSLLDPSSGSSSSLVVQVDLDGSLLSAGDRVPLAGSFAASVDTLSNTTSVVFDPAGELPSAGTGAVPRKIVLSFQGQPIDLAGFQLVNLAEQSFTPEVVSFDSVAIHEDFGDTSQEDVRNSSAFWGSGMLIAGVTGGAGFLGELIVEAGQELVLATQADAGALPGSTNIIQSLDVLPLGGEIVVPGQVPSAQITDGVYAFSHVRVEPGASLRFEGQENARLYARGELAVLGELDASGHPPEADLLQGGHASDLLAGGLGGRGGPGAGRGGQGADRYDATGMLDLLAVGALPNPGAVLDGRAGEGVAADAGQGGGGTGGAQWPSQFPTGVGLSDLRGLLINNTVSCSSDMIGSPGGGGSFAGLGGSGIANPPLLLPVPTPPIQPPTPGGDNSGVPLDPSARELDPQLGHLRGGSGGGGGGTSLHTTQINGLPLACNTPIPPQVLQISNWFDHSGAGGGGGGGGLQANARRLTIDGQVRVRGGHGGRSTGTPNTNQLLPNNDSAAPGGGGSGGSFLGQALELTIAAQSERIDVSGGEGGDYYTPELSQGGQGGHGLVRLESLPGALSLLGEGPKVAAEGAQQFADYLSVGSLQPKTSGPSAYSGSQSCWIRPEGNFFELNFADDDLSDPLNPQPGWDIDVVLNSGFPLSWRGPNPILPVSLESVFGSNLMGATPSPLVVRFQGVHAYGELVNPCEVDVSPGSAEVLPESRTAWVRHPAELNGYWDHLGPTASLERRINAVRFQIVFDNTGGLFPGVVLGVTDLRIVTQPD